MNLILEHATSVAFHTDMRATLRDALIIARQYDWYISNIETNCYVPELRQNNSWVTGAVLEHILQTSDFQFIWAVFSAFPLGSAGSAVSSPPIADGNDRYWMPPEIAPEIPGACLEIVCWDSAATILIGLPDESAAHYIAKHPEAKLLSSTWPKSAV